MTRQIHPSPLEPGPADFGQIEQAFHSLIRSYGRLRQVMDPYFARFGISASQWAILRVLQRAEAAGQRGLRLTDLGQRLLIRPPSVTGVVDRLERQGLLARQSIPTDQRARLVALTPAGRKLVATVLKGHAAQIRLLFTEHNPGEIENLACLLKKLETRLGTLAHDAEP
jgi:DNA-binding MarR family transcriptional regulator